MKYYKKRKLDPKNEKDWKLICDYYIKKEDETINGVPIFFRKEYK